MQTQTYESKILVPQTADQLVVDNPYLDERTFGFESDTGAGKVGPGRWNGLNTIGGGVKVYRALLTQTGTDAPVATVLENTLGGTPLFGYTGVGEYTVTLVGGFPANKVAIEFGPPSSGFVKSWRSTDDLLLIETRRFSDSSLIESGLTDTLFTVLVYP